MKTIWETSPIHRTSIEAVCCVKSTEKTVWIEKVRFRIFGEETKDVIRQSRIGQYYQYHETWDLAHAHLLRVADSELDEMKAQYDAALAYVEKVKSLSKPDGV